MLYGLVAFGHIQLRTIDGHTLQAVKGATFLTIEASIGPDIGAGLIDVAKKAFARVK